MSSVVQKKRKKRSPNITIGTRVSGAVGPLEIPSVAPGDSTKKRRRKVHRIMYGTVIGSKLIKHWRVYWDDMLVTGDHTSWQLNILSPTKNSLSPNAKSVMESAPHIGMHSDVREYCKNGVPHPRESSTSQASTEVTRTSNTTSSVTTTQDSSTIVIATNDVNASTNTLSSLSTSTKVNDTTNNTEADSTSTASIPSALLSSVGKYRVVLSMYDIFSFKK